MKDIYFMSLFYPGCTQDSSFVENSEFVKSEMRESLSFQLVYMNYYLYVHWIQMGALPFIFLWPCWIAVLELHCWWMFSYQLKWNWKLWVFHLRLRQLRAQDSAQSLLNMLSETDHRSSYVSVLTMGEVRWGCQMYTTNFSQSPDCFMFTFTDEHWRPEQLDISKIFSVLYTRTDSWINI